jgi:hypothetical protein
VKDRGKPGRGPKILPEVKRPGSLGEGFFSKSEEEQKRILGRFPNKQAQGKMQWVATMNKRTNPKVALRATKLRSWLSR